MQAGKFVHTIQQGYTVKFPVAIYPANPINRAYPNSVFVIAGQEANIIRCKRWFIPFEIGRDCITIVYIEPIYGTYPQKAILIDRYTLYVIIRKAIRCIKMIERNRLSIQASKQ